MLATKVGDKRGADVGERVQPTHMEFQVPVAHRNGDARVTVE